MGFKDRLRTFDAATAGRTLGIFALIVIAELALGSLVPLFGDVFPLVIVAALAAFIIVFMKPLWGVMVALFFISFVGATFSYRLSAGIMLRPRDVVFPPVLLAWMLLRTFAPDKRVPIQRTDINNALYALGWYCALSIVWAASASTAISKTIQYVFDLFLFFLIVDIVETRDDLRKVCHAWCVGGVFISVICLAQLDPSLRSKGLTDSAVGLAEALGYPITLAIYMFLVSPSRIQRFIYFCVTGIILLGTMSTQSRAPLIGFGAGCLFILWAIQRSRPYMTMIFRYLGIALLILLVLLVFMQILGIDALTDMFNKTWERFTSVLFEEVSEESGAVDWRIQLWAAAWQMFLDSPLLGQGAGGFSDLCGDYGTPENADIAHNIFLQLLCEFGIVGYIFIIYFIYRLLHAFRRLYHSRIEQSDRILLICLMSGLISKAVRDMTAGMVIEDRSMFLYMALIFTVPKFNKLPMSHHEAQEAGHPSDS